MRKITLLALALCLSWTVSTTIWPTGYAISQDSVEHIEGEVPELVYENEYVLTVSPIAALKKKAVAEFDASTTLPVDVVDSTARVVLLKATPKGRKGKREQTSQYERRSDLCRGLKSSQRSKRRTARAADRFAIVRNISCSPNAVLRRTATPNDSHYNLQWGLKQANGIDIKAEPAWDVTKGSNSVVIAVIDSGVDYTHPDLVGNMRVNPGEIAGNGIDDDGNGVVDDVYGYNAINNSGNPMDDNGHGTHVAGTIGATSNNGLGVTGVAWNVKMIGVKFLGSNGSGSLFDAIKSVDYVTNLKNRGVNIIASNNSWGGGGFLQPMYDAIMRHRNAGIVFIAAAGNSTNNNDSNPSYPANYGIDSIISVAAVDNQGALASFSNYGATTVHIAAPGVTIASTYPQNRYVYLSGTSMAAPHVAGAVALLASHRPGLTVAQIRQTILSSGTTLPSLAGKVSTGKFLNLQSMLASAPNAGPTPTPTNTPTPQPTSTPTPVPTSTPTPSPTPTPVPGHWTISGVVKVDGVVIADAQVLLEINGSKFYRGTASNGTFSFDAVLGPAPFTLTATKAGFTFNQITGTLNSHRQVEFNGSARSYTVSGRVINENQQPLVGVAVLANGFGSSTTNSNGEFSFAIPYGTRYSLTVSSSEYTFGRSELTGIVYGDVERIFVGSQ